jgi:hypothetical protein
MKTIARERSGLGIISIIALLFGCGGCLHTRSGLSMTDERTAFIRNGVTTREEIVETLGPPLHDLRPERTFAYYWEIEGPSLSYSVFGKSNEIDGKFDRWLFIVRLDESNRVDRHGKTRQLETETAREAILRWLEQPTD